MESFKPCMSLQECSAVYDAGIFYHHYANTAYPLTPASFRSFQIREPEEIEHCLRHDLSQIDAVSLYIHIPFCQTRCRFCEYVVLDQTDEALQDEYVDLLLLEMKMYAKRLKGKRIVGFDLGGGTPTILSVRNLRRITDAVRALFAIPDSVVMSIETTPLIAAKEPEKIRAVYQIGYRRISMGIQTVSSQLLATLNREGSSSLYEQAVQSIRDAGFERLNVDLMYGFLRQTDQEWLDTIRYAVQLQPDYITLYRNRYKGTKIQQEAGGVSVYKAIRQYRIAFQCLHENGFLANVGKNTFSRIPGDYGTSDYLTTRVIQGTPYLGMGLGAQSFFRNCLSYNLGTADKSIERYRTAITAGQLPLQDFYCLPQEEAMAKMISVAFYFAFIDLPSFERRFGVTLQSQYPAQLQFVLEHHLMKQIGDRLYLTERGADYINGVIPLFYSKRSQAELQTVFQRQAADDAANEELFLASYRFEAYQRPSVTADVVAVSIYGEDKTSWRKDRKLHTLSLLLVRRGEHPFVNRWALPGGFVRMDETVEACALREIIEETHITPNTIMPIGSFSECDRDPRGRVISHGFVSIIGEEGRMAMGGDDALEAQWFQLEFTQADTTWRLVLRHKEIRLCATLEMLHYRFGYPKFRVLHQEGFAFDHAVIIATALVQLRHAARQFELLFDFLPERFTLSALQQVQETILNETTPPANFRRKVAPYVIETDAHTTGAGHRPAKLFMRRNSPIL